GLIAILACFAAERHLRRRPGTAGRRVLGTHFKMGLGLRLGDNFLLEPRSLRHLVLANREIMLHLFFGASHLASDRLGVFLHFLWRECQGLGDPACLINDGTPTLSIRY